MNMFHLTCAIDFDYFSYLNTQYPNANWKFYIKDGKQHSNVQNLIRKYSVKNTEILEVKK